MRLPDGKLDSGWYCEKYNGPGVTYELVTGLYTGYICGVDGPYKTGDWSDLRISVYGGLIRSLRRDNELCIADGTYQNPRMICYDRHYPEPLLELMAGARARQEAMNGHFQRCAMFTCVRGWRHDMETHALYFHSIANILQLVIQYESPLFGIDNRIRDWDEYFELYLEDLDAGVYNN